VAIRRRASTRCVCRTTRPSRPYEYDPAKHDALFPDGSHKRLERIHGAPALLSGLGPPSSEDEIRNELGNHGEAPIVEWKQQRFEASKDGVTLWYGAELPKTQFRVSRKVTLPAGRRHSTSRNGWRICCRLTGLSIGSSTPPSVPVRGTGEEFPRCLGDKGQGGR
jgi:hypothetical protein